MNETTDHRENAPLAGHELTHSKVLLAPKRGRNRADRTGYFGVGIVNPKTTENVGTLWRSAASMGAAFTFQIGGRLRRQASDTTKAWRLLPHYELPDVQTFRAMIPHDCIPVAVELTADAVPLSEYQHPERAIYVLGAEDNGIPKAVMDLCAHTVILPGRYCLNVAVAGSVLMYDRCAKRGVQ